VGHTGYVWVLPLNGALTGAVFACVEATDGCTEQRLAVRSISLSIVRLFCQ
jgi:hypothetical protein